jgi:hypothetical protein
MNTLTRFERPVRTTPIRHKITYSVPPPPSECVPADFAWLFAALHVTHDYPADMLAKRRAEFVEQVQELPAETLRRIAAAVGVPAEIATDGELAYRFDPDSVDCDTPEVTEAMDLRNSREFPF